MEKILRRLVAGSVCFMLIVISLSVITVKEDTPTALAVSGDDLHSYEETNTQEPTSAPVLISEPSFEIMSEGTLLVDSDRWKKLSDDFKGNAQIIVPKAASDSAIKVTEDAVNKTIKLQIDDCDDSYFDICNVQRVSYGQYFIGEAKDIYANDVVEEVTMTASLSSGFAGRLEASIELRLDHVYEPVVHEYKDVYCIDLRKPRDVYDHIIVIDAGHGGKDSGCNSVGWMYYEKNSTLEMVTKLKKRLDKTNIKVYYTRLNDSTVFLRPRVELANEVGADMFISIHCNYYDYYWRYNVSGAEVLYSSVCKGQKNNSKKLAEYMLDNLVKKTELTKREIVDRKSDLYILRKSLIPSVIVETAYMSNVSDLQYVIKGKKMNRVVKGLYNGIIDAYENLYNVHISNK